MWRKSIKTRGARWFIIRGSGKAMIAYVHFLEDYGMETEFIYLDDDTNGRPPEFSSGQVPFIGFHIKELHKLRDKDHFHLNIILFYLKDEYTDGELLGAMNIFKHPVRIEVEGFSRHLK